MMNLGQSMRILCRFWDVISETRSLRPGRMHFSCKDGNVVPDAGLDLGNKIYSSRTKGFFQAWCGCITPIFPYFLVIEIHPSKTIWFSYMSCAIFRNQCCKLNSFVTTNWRQPLEIEHMLFPYTSLKVT
jgi:hypothetical protein